MNPGAGSPVTVYFDATRVPTAWGEWPIYLVAMPGRTLMATRTSVVPSSCRTRFCMLAYSFYEGDTRILQYATALAKRGDVVDVIALRRKGQPKHRSEERRVGKERRGG